MKNSKAVLLAVDLGIKTGLACYKSNGRLAWYRSHNFGSVSRMRKGVVSILNDLPDLEWLVIEGGGQLAPPWQKEAAKRCISLRQISAEVWRNQLLYPRQQRSGTEAKKNADQLARAIIKWSDAPNPTSLRHDAAEAIVIGMWAVLDLGWLPKIPVR